MSVPAVLAVQLLGRRWQGPLLRAVLAFLLAGMIPGGMAGWLGWLLMAACYGWLMLAVYRVLRRPPARPAAAVALHDGDACPTPLDEVVSLDLQPQMKPREWSLELLHALEWKRMADLCLAFYKGRDLSARNVTVGADGSMDAQLYQPGEETPFALWYCKARGEQEVGEEAVAALIRQMAEAGVEQAFFMGAWSFSPAAQTLASLHQVTLLDDRMFLALLRHLPYDDSQRLLNLAVEGDYTTPTCPACLLKMIPRQNEAGCYWGCRAYPHCKHTLGMQV